MSNSPITESRFPQESINRYPSEARLNLKDYIEKVGDIIKSQPADQRSAIVDKIRQMPNLNDKSEALLATTFQLYHFEKKDRSSLLKEAIEIFGAERKFGESWRTPARLAASKAIFHGSSHMEPEHQRKLESVIGQRPMLSTMLEEYGERQMDAVHASAYPYRNSNRKVNQEKSNQADELGASAVDDGAKGFNNNNYNRSLEKVKQVTQSISSDDRARRLLLNTERPREINRGR